MNQETIPGSTDATGLFTAKNPYRLLIKGEKIPDMIMRQAHEELYDIAHPPLFCYNKNNELVKGVEGLEVKGPVWQAFTIADEKNDDWDWFNCLFPHGEYAQHGIETRQVYIAVQPTEKAAITNTEASLPAPLSDKSDVEGVSAENILNFFSCSQAFDEMTYASVIEAMHAFKNATDQEKLMQGEWVPISNPPKKDGVYLVFGSIYADTPRKVLRCNYYKKVFKSDSGNGVKTKNITHWMPLPKEPIF